MVDVIVIGGSFAGLAAALQVARARRTIMLIDAGTPRNRFARASHGFLGQDGRSPTDIIRDARTQLLCYPNVQFVQAEAHRVQQDATGFKISFGHSQEVLARRLVLATGVIDHLPDIPGLADRWGEGVIQCPYCHGYEIAGRRLGILATSEASLHQAKLIPDWSNEVTLFTNESVALNAEERAVIADRGIRIVDSRVVTILGEGHLMDAVELTNGETIPLDNLFVIPRTTFATPFAEQLGCAIEDGRFGPVITTDALKQTSVKGVFAAGDIARATHNATWAASDGVTAGIYAHQSLIVADNPYQKST